MAGERIFSDDLNAIVNAGGTTAHALVPSARYGGRRRTITGNFELTTGEIEATDIIVLARVPSNAVLYSIKIANDALDGGASITIDIGTYQPDGTVVDADCYADGATTLQAATAAPGDELRWNDAATATVAQMGQFVWEDGGEASDPSEMRDIAITIATAAATAAAGTIGYEIEYGVG